MEFTGKETTNVEGASVQGLDVFEQISSEMLMTLTSDSLEHTIESINSGAIKKFGNATDSLRGMVAVSPQ